jgi:hypothetical protein
VRPSRQLSQAEAATLIQSWWRMRRLARQQPALHALMELQAQLRLVAAKFDAYKAETGCIRHKQYLELNELAMRVLLQLDCTPCGVPELRAVRKRLAASAVSLLDSIQAAFSATVTASMEVPDSVVEEAMQGNTAGSSRAEAAAPASSSSHDGQEVAEAGPAFVPECDGGAADVCGPEADVPLVRVVLRCGGQSCEAGTQTD